jgi:hypothetical protein
MANPTTRKRIGPTVGTGAAVTAYTVPANTIARLTQIHFASSNTIGNNDVCAASIGALATGTALLPTTAVCPGGGTLDTYGAPTGYMLAAAETIQVKCPATAAWTITLEETTLG